MTSLAFPERRDLSVDLYPKVTRKVKSSACCYFPLRNDNNGPFPDFMTKARRLLMLSAVFFAFFEVGAIFAYAPARCVMRELASNVVPQCNLCSEDFVRSTLAIGAKVAWLPLAAGSRRPK